MKSYLGSFFPCKTLYSSHLDCSTSHVQSLVHIFPRVSVILDSACQSSSERAFTITSLLVRPPENGFRPSYVYASVCLLVGFRHLDDTVNAADLEYIIILCAGAAVAVQHLPD